MKQNPISPDLPTAPRLVAAAGFCYGTAICYFMIAVLFFMQPPIQRIRIGSTDEAFLGFFNSYAVNPWPHMMVHVTSTIMCLLVLGLIPAVGAMVRNQESIIARWATTMGFLGYAVFAAANARSINAEYDFAKIITRLTEQDLLVGIAAGKTIELERLGLITFGCAGLWILLSSLRGMKLNVFSRGLGFTGVGFALMNFFIIGDFWPYLGVGRPAQIAIGLGAAVLGPLWFIGLGNRMRKQAV